MLSILLVLVVLLESWLNSLSVASASRITVVVATLTLVAIRSAVPTGESSASFLFVLTAILFNLGLTPLLALHQPLPNYGSQPAAVVVWLNGPQFKQALLISLVAVLALGLGACLGHLPGRARHRDAFATTDIDELSLRLGGPASALMVLSVLAFFLVGLTSGGASIFFSSYGDWSAATQGGALPFIYATISFGAGMLALATPSGVRRIGLVAFGVFVVVILLIGLRSYALFPLVSFVVMLSYRRRLVTGIRLVVGALLILTLISAVAAYRNDTVAHTNVGPQYGIAEMGSSLRPLVEVLGWQQNGQQPLGGRSLVNPFIRIAHRALPLLGPNLPPQQDPNLLSTVTSIRLGGSQIGFSQVAESYDNWKLPGVLGVSILTGFVLAWIDRSPKNLRSQVVRNVIFVALLFWIRNSFTPVPGQMLLGGVLCFVVYLGAARRPRRNGQASRSLAATGS